MLKKKRKRLLIVTVECKQILWSLQKESVISHVQQQPVARKRYILDWLMMMSCFLWYGWPTKGVALFPARIIVRDPHLSRISDTPRAGFKPAQNLSSGFDESSCAVVITTTPRSHKGEFIKERYYGHVKLLEISFMSTVLLFRVMYVCIGNEKSKNCKSNSFIESLTNCESMFQHNKKLFFMPPRETCYHYLPIFR